MSALVPDCAAFTLLPGDVIERYHHPLLDACHVPACARRHATRDELDTFADDDRERGRREGVDHR